ncbi:hypothetical protein F5Y11DRAFT_349214 [Daldinia sp. FL1419]|nr:hypothetical protein F5Y11DRAFT_349214 [Daldinia sp. FL1419]
MTPEAHIVQHRLTVPEHELEVQLDRPCDPYKLEATHIRQIQTILGWFDEKHGRKADAQWQPMPRTYYILRRIGDVHYMNDFISNHLSDFNLPYDHRILPKFRLAGKYLALRQEFLDVQPYFLSDLSRVDLESYR